MAEPTSTAAAGYFWISVWLMTLLPGVDANALYGAFAGAVTFVLYAKDTPLVSRLGYGMISLLVGYYATPDTKAALAGYIQIRESFIVAFVVSVVIMTVTLTMLDRIKKLDVGAVWGAFVSGAASIFKRGE